MLALRASTLAETDNEDFLALEARLLKDLAFKSPTPDAQPLLVAAAEAYESQGSYNLAISEYRQVLALEPERPGIHYRLGRTLLARSFQVTSAQDVADAEIHDDFGGRA